MSKFKPAKPVRGRPVGNKPGSVIIVRPGKPQPTQPVGRKQPRLGGGCC